MTIEIETRRGERGGELPSCYRRRQLGLAHGEKPDRSEPKIQQPTGDGSGNSQRRGDGGRGGGRGGGCSGDSLCGGSGSGNGDSNVVATMVLTEMCDKHG
jgi:hypothetical protein